MRAWMGLGRSGSRLVGVWGVRGVTGVNGQLLSRHSRQLRTAAVHTSLRHCLRIPPLDMFFSASRSEKLSEDAKTSTSVIYTSRWRKATATSIAMPWVGSITSSS
uniref:Uncharacterized protein n=1 Tax=Ixodes ricinus TaxID=34613 RepID=A0A6B0UIJ7_IXORI